MQVNIIRDVTETVTPDEHNRYTNKNEGRILFLEMATSAYAFELGGILARYHDSESYKLKYVTDDGTWESFLGEYTTLHVKTLQKYMQFYYHVMAYLIDAVPFDMIMRASYAKVLTVRKQIEQAETPEQKKEILQHTFDMSRSDLRKHYKVEERPCPDCGKQLKRICSWECPKCGWGGKE